MDEDDQPLKPFRVRVNTMSASYSGKVMATSADDAISRQRESYRRSHDDRAGWTMSAQPWTKEDDADQGE